MKHVKTNSMLLVRQQLARGAGSVAQMSCVKRSQAAQSSPPEQEEGAAHELLRAERTFLRGTVLLNQL